MYRTVHEHCFKCYFSNTGTKVTEILKVTKKKKSGPGMYLWILKNKNS